MRDLQKIADDVRSAIDEFFVEHEKNINGNKSAGMRARVKSMSVRNLLKSYKAESIVYNSKG